MNSKTARKYNLIIEIATMSSDHAQIPVLFTELCATDFQAAFEMWEFKLAQNQNVLSKPNICINLEEKLFGIFLKASETKTRQMLCESLPLVKLIYQQCATAARSHNLVFLVNLILANKTDTADEILRCLKSNTMADFNELMRTIIDTVFSTYCVRNNVKVPVFNRKQKALLLDYVEKIKGPNKALLRQRLKEL